MAAEPWYVFPLPFWSGSPRAHPRRLRRGGVPGRTSGEMSQILASCKACHRAIRSLALALAIAEDGGDIPSRRVLNVGGKRLTRRGGIAIRERGQYSEMMLHSCLRKTVGVVRHLAPRGLQIGSALQPE